MSDLALEALGRFVAGTWRGGDGATIKLELDRLRAALAEAEARHEADLAIADKERDDWKSRAEAAEAKLAEAQETIACYEAMKSGVTVRIADLEERATKAEAERDELTRGLESNLADFDATYSLAKKANDYLEARVARLEERAEALAKALERTPDVLDVAATFAEETRHLHYEAGNVDGERTANAIAKECRIEETTVRAALASWRGAGGEE